MEVGHLDHLPLAGLDAQADRVGVAEEPGDELGLDRGPDGFVTQLLGGSHGRVPRDPAWDVEAGLAVSKGASGSRAAGCNRGDQLWFGTVQGRDYGAGHPARDAAATLQLRLATSLLRGRPTWPVDVVLRSQQGDLSIFEWVVTASDRDSRAGEHQVSPGGVQQRGWISGRLVSPARQTADPHSQRSGRAPPHAGVHLREGRNRARRRGRRLVPEIPSQLEFARLQLPGLDPGAQPGGLVLGVGRGAEPAFELAEVGVGHVGSMAARQPSIDPRSEHAVVESVPPIDPDGTQGTVEVRGRA